MPDRFKRVDGRILNAYKRFFIRWLGVEKKVGILMESSCICHRIRFFCFESCPSLRLENKSAFCCFLCDFGDSSFNFIVNSIFVKTEFSRLKFSKKIIFDSLA